MASTRRFGLRFLARIGPDLRDRSTGLPADGFYWQGARGDSVMQVFEGKEAEIDAACALVGKGAHVFEVGPVQEGHANSPYFR